MIGRRHLLGATALLALLPHTAKAKDSGRFVDLGKVRSNYIAPTKVVIWLPPGYDNARQRYGVVYMHDGQNLFDPKRSNFNKVWAADQSAMRLIAAGKVKPFIIVGIDQPGEDRGRQYFPRVMADLLSPAVRDKLTSQGNGKPIISDEYLKFIVSELKPHIDRKFRTKADRKHTAIAGSSMGGLISLYAVTRYTDIFGTAGAVSTHLPLGDPNWTASEREDIFAAWRAYAAKELRKPAGRRIWFDHGTETLDAFYEPYQQVLDAALEANGWVKGRDFSSRVYKGTPHEENAWAARLDDVFGWMLKGW
ncbi:MAG: alpha/beta hydrolase [Sphingomonadaceae bacterium]|nr:alpha/beta hydrolase [Sphingomonadaceae bacterium]